MNIIWTKDQQELILIKKNAVTPVNNSTGSENLLQKLQYH
jgi:hypothetical protein